MPEIIDVDNPPVSAVFRCKKLALPMEVRSAVLPPKRSSIASLLHCTTLPRIAPLSITAPPPIDWLSTLEPINNFLPTDFFMVPIPVNKVIAALQESLDSLPIEKVGSIIAHHVSRSHTPVAHKPLPLWVITLWGEITEVRRIQKKWKDCVSWVQKGLATFPDGHHLTNRLQALLEELPWGGHIRGIDDTFPTENLTVLLSDSQTYGRMIRQLLAALLLELRHDDQFHRSPHILVDLEFSDRLIRSAEEDVAHYSLQQLEVDVDLGHKESVGGILFINNNHYTFFVLNFRDCYLGYGDSLMKPMPKKLQTAFKWWILRLQRLKICHQPIPTEGDWLRRLPVCQQNDSHSCGVLAINGLSHHLRPANVSLIRSPASEGDICYARLLIVFKICDIRKETITFDDEASIVESIDVE